MANREFKIELDNVEMINGSDDLLKDTKVTKVTLTGENKLNSLNSTFENCNELTSIEGDVNLDGVSDMTEMALNTSLDEIKVTNPTEENIQSDNSLNQVANVKIGGTKYAKGGVQDVVGSLEWNAENFTYEDTILDNVYTNSASIEESKNITVSDTLEQKATSIEITGQTYTNLVNGKATKNLLDEMSMQQFEGSPTQFTPHMKQSICLEYIEGQTYQNLVDGKGEKTLIMECSPIITNFNSNAFEVPQNQSICLEYIEGNTSQDVDNIQSVGELFESKNLFDYTQSEFGLLEPTNGNISTNESWKYTTNLISVKPNTTYCISQSSSSDFYYNIVEYNSSQSYLIGTSWEDNTGSTSNSVYNTFTTSSDTRYIRLGWKISSTEIQLEEDLIPTEFMEFDSEKYRIEIEIYDSRWDSI